MAFNRGKTTGNVSKREVNRPIPPAVSKRKVSSSSTDRIAGNIKKRQVSFEKPIVGTAKPRRLSRRR